MKKVIYYISPFIVYHVINFVIDLFIYNHTVDFLFIIFNILAAIIISALSSKEHIDFSIAMCNVIAFLDAMVVFDVRSYFSDYCYKSFFEFVFCTPVIILCIIIFITSIAAHYIKLIRTKIREEEFSHERDI